ncbi:hypothetical protein F5I97DRAFT_1829675 [Phlebopus sp. FC_14]|nr:hypothetical protein F5I97DRAFT_1829675 [Phlebopus sp. FC_14]
MWCSSRSQFTSSHSVEEMKELKTEVGNKSVSFLKVLKCGTGSIMFWSKAQTHRVHWRMNGDSSAGVGQVRSKRSPGFLLTVRLSGKGHWCNAGEEAPGVLYPHLPHSRGFFPTDGTGVRPSLALLLVISWRNDYPNALSYERRERLRNNGHCAKTEANRRVLNLEPGQILRSISLCTNDYLPSNLWSAWGGWSRSLLLDTQYSVLESGSRQGYTPTLIYSAQVDLRVLEPVIAVVSMHCLQDNVHSQHVTAMQDEAPSHNTPSYRESSRGVTLEVVDRSLERSASKPSRPDPLKAYGLGVATVAPILQTFRSPVEPHMESHQSVTSGVESAQLLHGALEKADLFIASGCVINDARSRIRSTSWRNNAQLKATLGSHSNGGSDSTVTPSAAALAWPLLLRNTFVGDFVYARKFAEGIRDERRRRKSGNALQQVVMTLEITSQTPVSPDSWSKPKPDDRGDQRPLGSTSPPDGLFAAETSGNLPMSTPSMLTPDLLLGFPFFTEGKKVTKNQRSASVSKGIQSQLLFEGVTACP